MIFVNIPKRDYFQYKMHMFFCGTAIEEMLMTTHTGYLQIKLIQEGVSHDIN